MLYLLTLFFFCLFFIFGKYLILNKLNVKLNLIRQSLKSIQKFMFTSTDTNNPIDQFISDEFDIDSLIGDLIRKWIPLQSRLTSFQFLDFERHVNNSVTEYEFDFQEYIRSVLLSGLLITFSSFVYMFSSFDADKINEFVKNQLFSGIATAFCSTIAAIIYSGYLSYIGIKHNSVLKIFKTHAIEILITKVHPFYESSSTEQAIQQTQEKWKNLTQIAEESANMQRGLIELMRTNMTALTDVIDNFVRTSSQNRDIVDQIKLRINEISQQNETIEKTTENLNSGVEAIKSIFDLENSSIENVRKSLDQLNLLFTKQREDYSSQLHLIGNNQETFSTNINELTNTLSNSGLQVYRMLEIQEQLHSGMMQQFTNFDQNIINNRNFMHEQVTRIDNIVNTASDTNKDLLKSVSDMKIQFTDSIKKIEKQFSNNVAKSTKDIENLSRKIKISSKNSNKVYILSKIKSFFSKQK